METSTIQKTGTTLRWRPIKVPVRPGMQGTETSQDTGVTRSDFTSSQTDSYKMEEMEVHAASRIQYVSFSFR